MTFLFAVSGMVDPRQESFFLATFRLLLFGVSFFRLYGGRTLFARFLAGFDGTACGVAADNELGSGGKC